MHLARLISDLEMTAPAVWAWLASALLPAATTLVTAVWQGAVIACGLEIALRIMPRIAAAHRFAVWAAGFVIGLGLPWMPLMHFETRGAESSSGVAGSAATPLLQLDSRWVLAIAALWALASAARAVILALHSIRLRRLWKAAQPVEVCGALAAVLETVRRGRATICTTEMLDRPSVIGFMAPRILIPAWLMARLTQDELEQIVLHEVEHLLRRDDWTNLLQKLALVAFPLNPALVWMEYRLCRERERACDEGVVRITNAPRAYAACLASLAERGLNRRVEALSLGAWQKRPELVHRVHGILWRKHSLSRSAAAALLGSLGCALLVGSVEMERCPQLVAFVPKQKSIAMTPERQREMTAMLAQEGAETEMKLPPGFKAVPAKEVMPKRALLVKAANPVARKSPAEGEVLATEGTHQIAQANADGDRVNPGPEQQWVVLAAWEDVQTVSRTSSNTMSDYGAHGLGDNDDGQPLQNSQTTPGQSVGNPLQPNRMTSQYTVTRLILRVVPANTKSNSTQSTTGTVRGGWFVIQL